MLDKQNSLSLLEKQYVFPQESSWSIENILLANRHLPTNLLSQEGFLHPQFHHLHDPYLFPQMQEAVDRILKARDNCERIVIFGDYDVDGVSSTALLVKFLTQIGCEVSYRLPHRVKDGYGLKAYFIDELKSKDVSLVITVDCWTRDIDVINHAHFIGVDVIVTDHHAVPHTIPEHAIALLNPKIPNTTYPFSSLSGSWVAFKLLHAMTIALEKNTKKQEEILRQYIDIATLGTIADCMPLIGENRIIATLGLRELRRSGSIGIRKLLEGKDPHEKDGDIVGFHIGPRINAAGRMDTPYTALSLLLAGESRIDPIVAEIEMLNTSRRDETKFATERALEEMDVSGEILWYAKDDIEHGIIGLIAGKLANDFSKVSIVLKDEWEKLVASARSGGVCDLMELLTPSAHLFIAYGGHREAAGFSVSKAKSDELYKSLCATYREIEKKGDQKTSSKITAIDKILSEEYLTLDFYEQVMQLGPYGVWFPKPIFGVEVDLREMQDLGSSWEHISFILKKSKKFEEQVKAVGFGIRGLVPNNQDQKALLIGELTKNIWNDRVSLQFMIRDIILCDSVWS